MRKFFIILLFLFFKIGISQQPNKGIDFASDNGKIYYKSLQNQLSFFALENIEKEENEYHFRFWNTNNCIEIEKSQNGMTGRVIFAIQNTDNKEEFLRNEFTLTRNQSEAIFNLIEYYRVGQIPTYEKIEGWFSGLDGNSYEIESNINGNYQFKNYWTPSIQTVPDAKIFNKFIYGINKIAKTDSLFQEFIKENKFSCYRYYGTSYSVCKILSKKQARIYNRLNKRKTNN